MVVVTGFGFLDFEPETVMSGHLFHCLTETLGVDVGDEKRIMDG